jgi:hypothetical protein
MKIWTVISSIALTMLAGLGAFVIVVMCALMFANGCFGDPIQRTTVLPGGQSIEPLPTSRTETLLVRIVSTGVIGIVLWSMGRYTTQTIRLILPAFRRNA